MVEVTPQRTEISIRYWRYLIFLLLLASPFLVGLWLLLSSHWGASNTYAELFRGHLSHVDYFRPTAQAENNLPNALRLHGLEKLGGNRYALLFSATKPDGAPVVAVSPADFQLEVGADRTSLRPVQVTNVMALHLKTAWSNPVTFASVMDYSGSMFHTDLQAIERNYSAFINRLAMPFAGGVLKFNHSVNELLPLSTRKSDIEAALQKPVPLGLTALYQGLDRAMNMVQSRPYFRFLLLTTDGNDNVGGATLESVVRRAHQHFISIFVLGFGWLNVDILKQLAEESDGYFVYVPDSSQLAEAFPKLADIVNNLQVAEFISPDPVSRTGSFEARLTVGGTILTRIR